MSSSNARHLFVASVALAAGALAAHAAEDLSSLEVRGLRGQSSELTRRDRYECHNWAVAQTGESPPAVPAAEPPPPDRQRPAERAIVGALIGAGVGSLFGYGDHDRNPGETAIVGAAAGAVIGAATAGAGAKREREKEAAAEEPSDYLRALTACLEGRGYSVRLPAGAELTASR